MQPVESSTGSGAVIRRRGGQLAVLTAAHVVADTRYLQIQRSTDRFSSEKFRASVTAICHEVDLALLTVDGAAGSTAAEALDCITPLALGSETTLPRVFDKVHVVGYPIGGDAVSVTEGVVSRVEVQEYSHSLRPGLALTVDAAINSGNSGGPVLDASTMDIVGVAFQKLVARGVELQGHAVPVVLIQRFLDEIEEMLAAEAPSPLRLRMPSLGCDYQTLEPPHLRRSLGLGDRHGVLINRLHYCEEQPAIRAGDVLLRFDGLELDDLGFCSLLGRRLHFAAARDLRATGGVVPMDVWRDGKELRVEHTLKPSRHFVPRSQYDTAPTFYVCGGLVFQNLTNEYLQGWNASERPSHLQELFLCGHLTPERREGVMLSQVLADEVNAGYDSGWVGAPIVQALNGVKVRDIAHLVTLVQEARKRVARDGLAGGGPRFLRFDVRMASGPYCVVLPTEGLDEADKRVSVMYATPASGCSEDLEPFI